MSYEFYKIMHITGLILLFLGLGVSLVTKYTENPDRSAKRTGGVLHGIGLVAALVGGMGLLARIGTGFQPWVIGKLLIWLTLGAGTVFARFLPLKGALALLTGLGALAAALAVLKPL